MKNDTRNELFGALPMRAIKDKRCTRSHLAVLAVVSHFDRFGRNGVGCYATQEHIGKLADCTATTVSKRISDLCQWGYLTAERQKNRRRMQYRVIHDTCSTGQVSTADTCPTGQVSGPTLVPQDKQIDSGKPALTDSAYKPLSNPRQHFEIDSGKAACTRVPASPHTQQEIVSEEEWWAYKSRVARLIRDGHVFHRGECKQIEAAFEALCDFDYGNRELEMAFESLFVELEYAEAAAAVG